MDPLEYKYLESDDPSRIEVARLQYQLANLRATMPPKRRNIIEMFFRGHDKKDIAKSLKTSNPTINIAINDRKGLKMLSLFSQLDELRNGPSKQQRRNLAWRIALSNEHKSPATSLRAVDLINRQSGDYQSERDQPDGGLTVNIQNFVITPPTEIPNEEKDITPNKRFIPLEIPIP